LKRHEKTDVIKLRRQQHDLDHNVVDKISCKMDHRQHQHNLRETSSKLSLNPNHIIKMANEKIGNEIFTQNRRLFVSSILMSSALALSYDNQALADEITWTASPINKRSGITVFKAEETYNVRFVTYLSRFLLSFDEECQRWWYKRAGEIPITASAQQVDMTRFKQFGSFAASVEVGLQVYEGADGPRRLMESLLDRYGKDIDEIKSIREQNGLPPYKVFEEERERGEIKEARRQIALMFGLLQTYQPVDNITKLLAAIDNASVQKISILKRGGGYAPGYGAPAVTFPPPEAGEGYEVATGRASLRHSSQILRIDIQKRGFGYSKAPTVTISEPIAVGFGSPFATAATAKSYIFRGGVNKGRIERIELLTPGQGYQVDEPIKVRFSPPDLPSSQGSEECVAHVVLEYEVDNIEIVNAGSGYAAEKPLKIFVDPPPLTARVNLNDPMVVKTLNLDQPFKKEEVYDPSSMNAKAWKMAKVGGGGDCVGRACYDDPVVAFAYPVADADSYSSFRSQNDSKTDLNNKSNKKEKISATGDDDGYIPQLPFGSPSSSTLLSLLPKGVGLSFNSDLGRYELLANEGLVERIDTPGKPIDPDFGPRGRSPIEREKKLTGPILLRFFAAGAICCSTVHLALTPLDVMKTSIQTDPKKYTDPITTFNLLLKENGVTGFFAGWIPTFFGFFVNGGVSYSLTEFFRRLYFESIGDIAMNYEIPIIVAASATSAFFGAFTLAPSEAIRIRSVAQPDYAPNAVGVVTRMIEDEGLFSLFSAVPAFLLKEIPFCIAKFTIFDVTTEYLLEAYPAAREDLQLSLLVTLAGGTLGGICAAFVSNPADATISTMKKAKSDVGPIETAKSMIESDGIPSLFRGLGVRMFFYTFIVGLQFLVYDAIRFSLGIGSDDLKLYLDVLGGALRETGGPV